MDRFSFEPGRPQSQRITRRPYSHPQAARAVAEALRGWVMLGMVTLAVVGLGFKMYLDLSQVRAPRPCSVRVKVAPHPVAQTTGEAPRGWLLSPVAYRHPGMGVFRLEAPATGRCSTC
jgi:hypothetical protein